MVVIISQTAKELDIVVRTLNGNTKLMDVEMTQGKDNILIEDSQIPMLVKSLTAFYSQFKAGIIKDDSETFKTQPA